MSTFSALLPALLGFMAKGKVRLGVVDLFFFPHHPPLFFHNKIMYELSFHHLLSFLLDFSNSLALRQVWKLLYAPMGDLTRFSKPAFDYFEWHPYAFKYIM